MISIPSYRGTSKNPDGTWRTLTSGYTAITDFLRDFRRPPRTIGFEVYFETPPGAQAQVDFAQFVMEFTDETGVRRIVWLFSMVHRFVASR